MSFLWYFAHGFSCKAKVGEAAEGERNSEPEQEVMDVSEEALVEEMRLCHLDDTPPPMVENKERFPFSLLLCTRGAVKTLNASFANVILKYMPACPQVFCHKVRTPMAWTELSGWFLAHLHPPTTSNLQQDLQELKMKS